MSKEPENPTEHDGDVSRREFLGTAGAALVVATAAPGTVSAQERREPGAPVRPKTQIRLTVNGGSRRIEVDDHWTLAELLRDHLRLTGTKLGCERGECGACTVIVDDKPVYSCSYLAVWADGKTVLTVEGLSKDGKLSPLQEAFVAHDAPQCGFCTSGQLMSAAILLKENKNPTDADIDHAMSGVICRCGTYNRIRDAIKQAAINGGK